MGTSHRSKFYPLLVIITVLLSLSACGGDSDGEGGEQAGPSPDDLIAARARLSIAELYRNQGQFRASAIEIQNALQFVPDNTEAQTFLAQLSMDIGDISIAVQLLTAVHEKNPGDNQIALKLAEALLVSGSVDQARLVITDLALPAGTQLNELNLMRGSIAVLDGDLNAAENAFQEVLASDAGNIDALILISQLEAQGGNLDRARDYINQAIAADSDNLDLWIWRAQFAMVEEDFPAAETAYTEALNLMALYDTMTAKKFTIMQSIIVPLQRQQKDAEALQYTQLLAETPQGQLVNDYSTALNMYARGDMQRAEEALTNILALVPENPNSNILMGMTRYTQGNFIEANELLTKFVDSESAAPQLIKALAASRLRVNQPDLALAAIEDALERFPEDPPLLAMKGAAQQALGNFGDSIASFQQALALSEEIDSAEMHLAIAASHFQLQDFPAAEEELVVALRLNPVSQEAKTLLIDVYLVQEDFDSAATQVQTWLDAEPESIFNNEAAGVVAIRQGRLDQARAHFDSILLVEPNHLQSKLTLGRLDIIEEKYQEAITRFQSVLDLQIDNSDAIGGLLTAGAANGTEEASIEFVERLVQQNDTLFVPPLTLAQYFLATERLDQGREYAEIAFARENNFLTQGAIIDVRLVEAGLLREQMRTEEALSLVESALALQENHIQAITTAAALEADRNNFEQAKAYVARLQTLLPNLPFPLEVAGDLFLAEGDESAALAAYEQAWKLGISSNLAVKLHDLYSESGRQPSDITDFLVQWTQVLPEDVTANLLLGMNYELQGRGEDAVSHYETVYSVAPDNVVVLNNLAWLYQDSRPARALELASKAAELYPDNADVLDTYGWILGKQNKRSQAIEVLERALELSPDNASIADHLANLRAQ